MTQTQTVTARTSAKTAAKPKTKSAVVKAKRPDTDLAEALEKMLAGEDEVIIYKNGKKAGAIISARAYKFLVKATDEEMDRRTVAKAEKALEEEGEITHEEIKKKYGIR